MMRKSILVLLVIFGMLLILPVVYANATADQKITVTTLFDPGNTPWKNTMYNVDKLPFENITTLDSPQYYTVPLWNGTPLIMNFWVDMNDGDAVNYTYTLLGGRTISGWITRSYGQITYNMDGVTDTENYWVIPFMSNRDRFRFIVWNLGTDDGKTIYEYGIGMRSEHSKLIITPWQSSSDVITSLYVSKTAGNPVLHEYETVLPISVYQMTANNSSWGDTTGSWGPNIVDPITGLWNTLYSVYTMFMVVIGLMVTILLFVLGPLPDKGIPGQNFIMLMLLLETGYMALLTNTCRDIWQFTKKFSRFQTNLYEFLVRAAVMMIGFFGIVFDAMVKLPSVLGKAAESILGVVTMLVALIF